MGQDSQQVLGDEIGRILSEAGITYAQSIYIRTAFVEMIQKNTMILSASVAFPEPDVSPVQRKNAVIAGVGEIAKGMLQNKIYSYEEAPTPDGTQITVGIHLIRNAGQ